MPQNSARFAPQTLDELEPSIHGLIKDTLGFSEPGLVQSALRCIQDLGGEDDLKERFKEDIDDDKKAAKLAKKIQSKVDEFCISHDLPMIKKSPKKRKIDEESGGGGAKKAKVEEEEAQMTPDQIRQMMANTLKEIAARKKQLGNEAKSSSGGQKTNPPQVGPMVPPPPQPPQQTESKTKALAALQAQIASRLTKIGSALPVHIAPVKLPAKPGQTGKPQPVILDSEGRTVDAQGQEIQLSHHVPTLKANLRAKKKDDVVKEVQKAEIKAEKVEQNKFFDPRMGGSGKTGEIGARKRSQLKFNEPGKYQAEGQRIRMKAQLEKLQAEISTISRKTGITSATQLAKLVPKDAAKGRIPDVEWWDAIIMEGHGGQQYEDYKLREGAVTNLIEHPIQMMPLESTKQQHIPVFLTKKEQKKLRRQNRREAWKEKQDKIRLGLLPPDEPKVKMSNLMRVLGNEAVQDPTKVEAHVRAQMAKRLANHEKMNADRKLTPEQKKDKMVRKLTEDTSCGVNVAIYRIKSLSNASKKFKVETNAKQLHMTGTIILYEDVNVVVVEGGPKQQKKYKQLMLKRIKWDDETYNDKEGVECDNRCNLVWEGQTKERVFGEVKMKQCPTESFARDFFKKMGVEHYWDQAYSGAVLEATEDTF